MSKSKHPSLADRAIDLSPRVKAAITLGVDVLLLGLCALLAVRLAHANFFLPASAFDLVWFGPLLTLPALFVTGAYRAVTRFIAPVFLLRLALGCTTAGLLLFELSKRFGVPPLTWNTALLFSFLSTVAIATSRYAARHVLRGGSFAGDDRTRVMIFGAGEPGIQLAAALQSGSQYRVLGFLDHRLKLIGREVMGLRVHDADGAAALKQRIGFEQVFLALPTVSRARRRIIVETLERLPVKVMQMPSLADLANGKLKIDDLRPVLVEDILGRDPIDPDTTLLDRYLRGKLVMVTGAGGSIGAELCRNALRRGARKLVLFELSETALYEIERELAPAAREAGCELVAALGSVVDSRALGRLLRHHQIETVYHAAAYKHVPLGERNACAFIENNVFGTFAVTQAVVNSGVENYVLISTDKAVRPSSLMGTTKRACELIVQAAAAEHRHVRMSMVRFGNVLASSGSVVPLFREQLAKGGPITVTDPEMTRYFMTIAEAAQLAIQAGAMGGRGEVLVLDMGEPVRILDLALRMIHLSGLTERTAENPDGDIEIRFTGSRPGEKLYEELLIGNDPQTTAHPRIFLARERSLQASAVMDGLARLRQQLEMGDGIGAAAEVKAIVGSSDSTEDGIAPVSRPFALVAGGGAAG